MFYFFLLFLFISSPISTLTYVLSLFIFYYHPNGSIQQRTVRFHHASGRDQEALFSFFPLYVCAYAFQSFVSLFFCFFMKITMHSLTIGAFLNCSFPSLFYLLFLSFYLPTGWVYKYKMTNQQKW